jgi:glycosyltransferase involved in cell wall biosynthesis
MNDREAPRVSIAMPVYNGERYLPEAVNSILAQTFADFELVLCDNASTDGTEDLCRRYAATDCRVRYHRNRRNIGVAANFDLASAMCTAALVKWAASDDVLGPTCLEDCVEILDHNADVVLAVPRGRLIDSSGNPIDHAPGVLKPIEWPAEPLNRVQRYIDMLTTIESVAVMLCLHGLFRIDLLPQRLTLRPYPMSDRETILSALLAGRFMETSRVSLFLRMHAASSGASIFDDPQKMWLTMNPEVPAPRLIFLWQHRTHRRLLSVLARTNMRRRDRQALQAYYLYRVARQIVLGKVAGAGRRFNQLLRAPTASS